MKRFGILLTLLLLSAAIGAAPVYKWTDKNGRVHYGDNPVFNAEKVQDKPGTAASETALSDSEQAKLDADCKYQKEQLELYQSAARLVEKDSLGNEKEYSAEEKQQLIDLTQKKIKVSCVPPPKKDTGPK